MKTTTATTGSHPTFSYSFTTTIVDINRKPIVPVPTVRNLMPNLLTNRTVEPAMIRGIPDQDDIIADAPVQGIVACAPIERVVAGIARESIGAISTIEDISSAVAGEHIVAVVPGGIECSSAGQHHILDLSES